MSSSTLISSPIVKDLPPPSASNLQPHLSSLPRRRPQFFTPSSSGSDSSKSSRSSSHLLNTPAKGLKDTGHTPVLVHRVPQPTQRVPQPSARGYLQPHISHLPRRPRRVARAPSVASSSASSCVPTRLRQPSPAPPLTPPSSKPTDKTALQCIHTPQLGALQGDQIYVAFCGTESADVVLSDWDRVLHIHVAEGPNVTESHDRPPKSKVLSISPASCNDHGVPNLSSTQIIEACAFLTADDSDYPSNVARKRRLLVTAPGPAHAVDAMAVAVAVRFLDLVGTRTPPDSQMSEESTPRDAHQREAATHFRTPSMHTEYSLSPNQRITPSFPAATALSPFPRFEAQSPDAESEEVRPDSPIHAILLAMQDLPPFVFEEEDGADYFAHMTAPPPGMASMRAHAALRLRSPQRPRRGPVTLDRSISQVAGVPGVEVRDPQRRVEFVHQDAGKGVESAKNVGLGLGVDIIMNRSRIIGPEEEDAGSDQQLRVVVEEGTPNGPKSESEGSSARAVAVEDANISEQASSADTCPALSVQEVGTPSRDRTAFANMTLKDQWRGVLSKEGMDYVWSCVSNSTQQAS